MATATTPSRPRFRTDLVAEPIEEAGQRFIDVIDPDTGYEYRFYEVEYSLACAMDGERDVAGLASWAQEELGITPTSSELTSVIATLGDLGYLEAGGAAEAAAPVRPPAPDIELGLAGGGDRRPLDPVPQVEDVELGLAGATERVAMPPAMRPSPGDFAPAGGGRPEMTKTSPGGIDVDLSADIPLAVSDVQEAVRQSKVMKATELPPELEDALASAEGSGRPVEPPPMRPFEPPPMRPMEAPPMRPVEPPRPVIAHEPARPFTPPTKPPVELPKQPPKVRPVEPPIEAPRTSPVLLFLLVLVILGAGGFAFWKWYWVPRHQAKSSTAPAPTTVPIAATGTGSAGSAAVKPETPTPPPPTSAKLEMSTPGPIDIVVEVSGSVATIGADGSVVALGDEIARLGGADKLEADLKSANRDVVRVQGDIDKLTPLRQKATGNTAAKLDARLKDRMESLAEKQETKARIEGEIAKLELKAPAAGTLKAVATKGQKVAANDVIATIQPQGQPTATFALRDGQTFKPEQEVRLTVKTPPGETPVTLACKVSKLSPGKLTVACPVDNPPATGSEVLLP